MTACSSLMASAFGRWKALRPMMEPKAPPAAISVTSFSTSSVPLAFAAAEDHDAASIEGAPHHFLHPVGEGLDDDAILSKAAAASFTSRCFLGGFTLMTWAPNWAAIWAA